LAYPPLPRRAGLRILVFVDDLLITLATHSEVLRAKIIIEATFIASGLTRAPNKGQFEPTQTLKDHLGFQICSKGMGLLTVPERHCYHLRNMARWFGPFVVLEAKGAQVTLDLPATFGKAHRRVNIHRLKFFEARDVQFGTADQPLRPLPGVDGPDKYEVSRICASRILKGRHELYVEWKGYDQSHNS